MSMMPGDSNAKEQIQRTPDHRNLESGGSGTHRERRLSQHEISDATYYQWKSKFGGMEASDIRRLRELEEENRRLKAMYAELSLEHRILKEVLTKKL